MAHLEGIFMRVKRLMGRKIDLGPSPEVSLLDIVWGGKQAAPTVEILLEVTSERDG